MRTIAKYYLNLWGCGVLLVVGYLLGAENYLAAAVMAGLLVIALLLGAYFGRSVHDEITDRLK